jgi:glycosyltransferase A (GT-A) superfamily protein (DUF2064 family)
MIDRTTDNLLLIGARVPRSGATKTRLGTSIGMERAAALYRAFLADLAVNLAPPVADPEPAFDLAWAYSPPDADFCKELRNATGTTPAHAHYVPQLADEDWGRRQSALLAWGHERGYGSTILVASDSPQLDRSVVLEAFAALKSSEVVIGRVLDGGYYLIGQRGSRDLLQGVEMSTSSAADGVIVHARNQGLRVVEAPATFDIDVEEDLGHLRAHLEQDRGRSNPATWDAMKTLGLLDI